MNVSSWSDELISEARRLEDADAINILLLSPTRGVMDLMVSSQNINIVLGMLDDSKAIYTVGETDSHCYLLCLDWHGIDGLVCLTRQKAKYILINSNSDDW